MAEHSRRSLVDDSMETVGSGKKAKAGGSKGSSNAPKIAIISVCLVLAAVLLAYNFKIIPNPFEEAPKPAVLTPEDNQVVEEYKKQNEAALKQPNPPVEGGS